MVDFRYAQFCPLTRAVEILGERWTLLLLRELLLGPKRFSDLKAALKGISPSVLTDRLAKLEERGIVTHRELPPPIASAVYELGDAGRALQPLLVELTRWGLRFVSVPGADDIIRPEWLLLGFQVFAREDFIEPISARLHVEAGAESIDLYVRSGENGTEVSREPRPYSVRISAPPLQMLMFANGFLREDPLLTIEGDSALAAKVPNLFLFQPTPAPPKRSPDPFDPQPHVPGGLAQPER